MQPYPGHPQAYPHQPPYGAAPASGFQGPGYGGAPAYDVSSIASIAKPTVIFLGIRTAFPILSWLAWKVMPRPDSLETYELISTVIRGVEGLLSFVAVVFFWVWFARVYSWVRATRGGTSYSNGLAIGGWFIPFANFVFPYLTMRDAWRRAMNDENGGLVLLWWLAYVLSSMLTVFYSVDHSMRLVPGDLARVVYPILALVNLVVELGAWGLWIFLVTRLTRRATTGT